MTREQTGVRAYGQGMYSAVKIDGRGEGPLFWVNPMPMYDGVAKDLGRALLCCALNAPAFGHRCDIL
jgi:hypothetical protein